MRGKEKIGQFHLQSTIYRWEKYDGKVQHQIMHSEDILVGLDLAWHKKDANSGVAAGKISDGKLLATEVISGGITYDMVKTYLSDNMSHLRGIAIDASLIIKNQTRQRLCETLIGREYGSRKASCHTSNLKRLSNSTGLKLERILSNHLEHLGNDRFMIEVYPHPAIIELFGLSERLLYKKGSVAQKKAGLARLRDMIRSLSSNSRLQLDFSKAANEFLDQSIELLKGKSLKVYEDGLDAVICLYLAGLWATNRESMNIYGDRESGYIVVPKPIS